MKHGSYVLEMISKLLLGAFFEFLFRGRDTDNCVLYVLSVKVVKYTIVSISAPEKNSKNPPNKSF